MNKNKTTKIIVLMILIMVIETAYFIFSKEIIAYSSDVESDIEIHNYKRTNKTILLGDSRTAGICKDSDIGYHSGKCLEYLGIYQSGAEYNWLIEKGIKGVNEILKKDKKNKYNIVVLLGVNDLFGKNPNVEQKVKRYMSTLNELAQKEWKKHNIIFVSVTPIEGEKTIERFDIYQKNINKLNSQMKLQILSTFNNISYCDINSDIDLEGKINPDRLHYTEEGYDEVYRQIKQKCLNNKNLYI